ncbi:ARHGB factor, partial [Syrrhaptes paradoxus]|nr:ARHGB factor [Syrrhaptes paradoxus]
PAPPFHRKFQDPQVQKHATQILRKMLRQEEAELQRFYEAYSRNPASAVEEQIEGARRRVSQLQLKILQETGGTTGARAPTPPSPPSRWAGLGAGGPVGAGRTAKASPPPHDGAPGSELCPLSPPQGLERAGRPLIIGPEEDCDPGYFNNECDSLFQDLAKLKSRPAHLGVFLRFIFSQADPSPLLFYLCADVCQQTAGKDSRGLGKDIWNIFLDRTAVRAGSVLVPAGDRLERQRYRSPP